MNLPNFRNQRGQGMTEYIIIVALIAVAAIGAFRYFGQTARSQVAAAAQEVAGQDGKTMTDKAKGAADNASAQASKDKTMANFADKNGDNK